MFGLLCFIFFALCCIGIYFMGSSRRIVKKGIFMSSVGWIGFITFGAWTTSGKFSLLMFCGSVAACVVLIAGIWFGVNFVLIVMISFQKGAEAMGNIVSK